MRVLVTGAAGWTAFSIIQGLAEARHPVVGFDLPGVAYRDEAVSHLCAILEGDVSNLAQVEATVRAAAPDAIIHLAVAVCQDDYRNPKVPFAVNVRGTYNVFEAARRNRKRRVVVMSSAAVHVPPTGADWVSSPGHDHLYDLTKHLQEEIARDFSATFGMEAVVLRAGHIVDGRKGVDANGVDLAEVSYCRGGWVCRYDLARACLRALEVDASGFAAYHVIGSSAARRRFDIERTERALGVTFETRFEEYA